MLVGASSCLRNVSLAGICPVPSPEVIEERADRPALLDGSPRAVRRIAESRGKTEGYPDPVAHRGAADVEPASGGLGNRHQPVLVSDPQIARPTAPGPLGSAAGSRHDFFESQRLVGHTGLQLDPLDRHVAAKGGQGRANSLELGRIRGADAHQPKLGERRHGIAASRSPKVRPSASGRWQREAGMGAFMPLSWHRSGIRAAGRKPRSCGRSGEPVEDSG